MLIPPLLPVNSQRRVAVLHVPLPTTDEWFDPGTNKKKRESRLNAASATPSAASSPTPLRRPRSKAAEGNSRAPTQGSATSVKQNVTNLVKGSTNLFCMICYEACFELAYIYLEQRMRSFLQHVSSKVFTFLHYIPSGLSVSAAWKTQPCPRKHTTQEPKHNFDER